MFYPTQILGLRKMTLINNSNVLFSVEFCLTDTVYESSILDWLFGFDPNCQVSKILSQGADPPPLPLSAAKAGRNNLNE